jgi:hypothetical protein
LRKNLAAEKAEEHKTTKERTILLSGLLSLAAKKTDEPGVCSTRGFGESTVLTSLLFTAFEKRVCANKESSSYIYILYHTEREEATGTIWERERSGKTTRVASSRVVVVEKEVH